MSNSDVIAAGSVAGMSMLVDELEIVLRQRFHGLPVKHIEGYVNSFALALNYLLEGGDQTSAITRASSDLESRKDFSCVNQMCEYSLAFNSAKRYPECFQFQVDALSLVSPPARGRKSFDFRFISKETPYNVEVKSFSRAHQVGDESQPVKIFLPREDCQALYDAGLRSEGTCRRALIGFLDKANTQLPSSGNGVNVVVICCNDVDEYADALECLIGKFGIVSDEGMLAKYPKIDAIVLTLTGLFHFSAIDPDVISSVLQEEGALPSDDFDFWGHALTLPVGMFFSKGCGSDVENDFKQSFQLVNDHLKMYVRDFQDDLQGAVFALFNATLGRLIGITPIESKPLHGPT